MSLLGVQASTKRKEMWGQGQRQQQKEQFGAANGVGLAKSSLKLTLSIKQCNFFENKIGKCLGVLREKIWIENVGRIL